MFHVAPDVTALVGEILVPVVSFATAPRPGTAVSGRHRSRVAPRIRMQNRILVLDERSGGEDVLTRFSVVMDDRSGANVPASSSFCLLPVGC